MSSITFMVNSLNDLSKVAEKIYHLSFSNRIFLFNGEMGSGKTTLIKFFLDNIPDIKINYKVELKQIEYGEKFNVYFSDKTIFLEEGS